jgi:hypothetical protein
LIQRGVNMCNIESWTAYVKVVWKDSFPNPIRCLSKQIIYLNHEFPFLSNML